MPKKTEVRRYKELCGLLSDALEQYADPEFYHAIAMLADRPAGGFADDFSRTVHPHYNRVMPGKLARQTLRKAAQRFGDLTIVSSHQEE